MNRSHVIMLKDVTFVGDQLIGASRVTWPGDRNTEDSPGIVLWLYDVEAPISCMYTSDEERDKDYELLQDCLKRSIGTIDNDRTITNPD